MIRVRIILILDDTKWAMLATICFLAITFYYEKTQRKINNQTKIYLMKKMTILLICIVLQFCAEEVNAKNNYNNGTESIEWNTVENRWEFKIPGLIAYSSESVLNPPSDIETWIDAADDGTLLLDLSGSGTYVETTVVYVDKDAVGENDGTSWADAFVDLNMAISATASGQIWVAEGTYYPHPSDQSVSFVLTSGIELYGGFDGSEENLSSRNPLNNLTILSGDLNDDDPAIVTDNSARVVNVLPDTDNSCIIDGFTIKRGYNLNGVGSGLYLENASLQISNCILKNNFSMNGSGIYAVNSQPVIKNCSFLQNRVFLGSGAGASLSGCTVTIENCVFSENRATHFQSSAEGAGGLSIIDGSDISIHNCVFYNNTGGGGGAIASAFSDVNVINSTFYSGGQDHIVLAFSGTNLLKNCIIWRANISTNINYDLDHCITNDLTVPIGVGNSIEDPLFIDISNPDGLDDIWGTADDGIRSYAVGPATGGGDPTVSSPTTDITGAERLSTPFDIGAYTVFDLEGCTDESSVDYNALASIDDGSCTGNLLCIETPTSTECDLGDYDLPCYDIDGDGQFDISTGLYGGVPYGIYWSTTAAYVKLITNSSINFPLTVEETDLVANSEGFFPEAIYPVVSVFVLESGITAWVIVNTSGVVTNVGLTTSDILTFDGVDECPVACDVLIDAIAVDNIQCSDEQGTVTVTASCESCTNALEYKLDLGDWQDSNVFDELDPGGYEVIVREKLGGATDCEVTQELIVELPDDTEVPAAVCGFVAIYFESSNTYTLTAADMQQLASGSSDNCTEIGDLIISVSPNTFDCDDLGKDIDVIVTVEDEAGNSSMCTTQVGVYYDGDLEEFSIESDQDILEGNSGLSNMTFTVTRNVAICERSVNYYTGDASAMEGVDYVEASGTLVFAAGEFSKTVDVSIIGDEMLEQTEFFFFNINSPSNTGNIGAGISNGLRKGTIINDEIIPNYEVNFMQYETLQEAIDALNGQTGTIFLIVDNYEDSSVSTIPSNVTLVVNQNRTITFTNDIIVNGEIGSRGTIVGNLTINGKYFGGGSVDGNVTNNGVLMIGGSLPVQSNLNGSDSSTK